MNAPAVVESPKKMSIAEYLEMEERSRSKHYFIKGQMIPMPGGTLKHNTISSNIVTYLHLAIRQKNLPYLVSNSDTKIWIPPIETFYYPDAVVIFEKPEYYEGRKDVLLNPLLIVEVASSKTEAHDRGQKFMDYSYLPSFKEYLIVNQDKPLARLSNRTESDVWQLSAVEGLDAEIELKSIGCRIAMRDIYFRTEDL